LNKSLFILNTQLICQQTLYFLLSKTQVGVSSSLSFLIIALFTWTRSLVWHKQSKSRELMELFPLRC